MTSRRLKILASCLLPLAYCMAHEIAGHPDVLSGSSVYIEPIAGNLDGSLAVEIVMRGVPLILARDSIRADYIITSMNRSSGTSGQLSANKRSFDGAICMIDSQTHRVVWIGDAGTSKRRKKPQKVAAQLVRKMQRDLFGSRSIPDRIDGMLEP
jgi:hypothetical protein